MAKKLTFACQYQSSRILGRVEEVVRGLSSSAKWNSVQALSFDSSYLETEMSLAGDLGLEEKLMLER
jgi:hypothetical protein